GRRRGVRLPARGPVEAVGGGAAGVHARAPAALAAPAADRARGDREPCGLSGLAAGLGDDGRGGAGRRRLRRLHRPLIRPATTPPGIIDSEKLLSVFHITGNYATLSVITLSWRSHGPENQDHVSRRRTRAGRLLPGPRADGARSE